MIFSRYSTPLQLLRIILFAILLLAVTSTSANEVRLSRADYIARYRHIAIDHQQRYGIPASITMAQGILESDSGNSILAKGSNNHFGIKCKSNWKGRTYYYTDDAPDECFRAYDSVEESYEDHAIFLDSSPRYDSLFAFHPTDYRSWARGLKGAGYATAPDYTQKLVKLIEENRLFELDVIAESGAAAVAAKSFDAATTATAKQPVALVDPNSVEVGQNLHAGYVVHEVNGCRYVVAKWGDTTASVARAFGVAPARLKSYNELKGRGVVNQGDPIFIEGKAQRWRGNIHTHTMLKGETLHSVAQLYGVKLSSLLKINSLSGSAEPAVGSQVKLK